MVVVSGGWTKNVVQYPNPSNNDMVISANNMSAKAVLICRPNSHPFQDRTLCLDEPVKVGRSVARAKATQTNAIFDCKVLSRHHAVLWYDCGKFFLQDTKSSNGTFVNNNRLSSNESEPHEVSSGDIVQFGVDVVENNNRKVTHGCIIATLKLYLPDGKEAKASPSLIEGNRQGYVPLEELYKLNQIIQEASQREQCLETKLLALQHVVDEARRSADESWQAYVGEERLLSRVAALEAQLGQAGKNIGEERLKEELQRLHEDRTTYQVAAKESVRKLLADRVEALGAAAEQQRARVSAEQEAMLARDELEKAQKEVQQIAQKLSEERKKGDEEKVNLEQKIREYEAKLEEEQQSAAELQNKIEHLKSLTINPVQEIAPLEQLEKCNLIIENDLKYKSEMTENCENENCDLVINQSNGIDKPEQNHINRSVSLDEMKVCGEKNETEPTMSDWESKEDLSKLSDDSSATYVTVISTDPIAVIIKDWESDDEDEEEQSSLTFDESENNRDTVDTDDKYVEEKERKVMEVDSRTLKYQFQTVQNELRRQIENLEQLVTSNKCKIFVLEENLSREKESNTIKADEIQILKRELVKFKQQWKESCNETQHLKDIIDTLNKDLSNKEEMLRNSSDRKTGSSENLCMNASENISSITLQQLVTVEEELVVLKEKFASVNDDKISLNKELMELREQYNMLCNRSHNTIFIYVAPLVLMVLYLLVSSVFS